MRVRVYTDGACSGNPGPGGWAICFNTDTDCITDSGCEYETTNNRMELTAMLKCLQRISKDGNKENTYVIYSDSAYVINAIKNDWLTKWYMSKWKTKAGEDVKNDDLWKQVFGVLSNLKTNKFDVTYEKVKGHSGVTFNELVDKLAVKERDKAKAKITI